MSSSLAASGALPLALPTSAGLVYTGACRVVAYLGYGGVAAFTLWDNTAGSGTVVIQYPNIAAGVFLNFVEEGIKASIGLYFTPGVGFLGGTVYILK
jgi:hypothetical protein